MVNNDRTYQPLELPPIWLATETKTSNKTKMTFLCEEEYDE